MTNYPRHIIFVTGLVEDAQGKFLMIKSPLRGWEPPGGQVELGEDAVTAWVREVKEESGYDIEVTCLTNVLQNIGGPNSEPKLGLVFFGRLVGGEPETSEESLAVGWFCQEEMLKLIESPPTRDRVIDSLAFQGKVMLKVYRSKPDFNVLRELV